MFFLKVWRKIKEKKMLFTSKEKNLSNGSGPIIHEGVGFENRTPGCYAQY